MRRILFLCYDFRLGGNAQVLSTILKHLHRSSFDPVLATFSGERGLPLPNGTREHILGVKGGGTLFRKLAVNCVAVCRLRRVLIEEKPDVVVGMGGMSNWALILAAKLSGRKIPTVIGEHGTGALEYREDRVTSIIMSLLNRFLYPFADRIIAISGGVRDYLVRDLKLPERKIVPITNPVEVERIQALSRAEVDHNWLVHKDKPVILWVGRITVLKGVQYLIGAFERVLREVDSRLILVGEGSYERRIRDMVNQKGLDGKVDFVGYQRNPYRYMPRADVFAFPSLGGEAFGLVLTEAMACGLPVVATDCLAGPSEVLLNGRCGVLVPVGDEEAMAHGIISILTDKTLRRRLVSAATTRVADFEPARIVALYERLFMELCDDRRTVDPAQAAS